MVAGLHGFAGSVLAHQTIWRAPNQRCSKRHSNTILVDSFLVDAPHEALAGPRSCPCVPCVPRGQCIIDVDHVGVFMASNAEHHMGLRPLAPFANVPSERHRFAPHDRCSRPRFSWSLGEPGPPTGANIDKECYLVDPASSHMLLSKIKPCMCKNELIQTVKL